MTSDKLYNLQQLVDIAADNPEFVDKMVKMFLDVTPALVDRIEAGLQLQDWDDVKAAAHKMKPSLDMMGIDTLYAVIRGIEERAKTKDRLEEIPDLFFKLSETLAAVYTQLRSI